MVVCVSSENIILRIIVVCLMTLRYSGLCRLLLPVHHLMLHH